jgi:SAM-dependent methyltransferase
VADLPIDLDAELAEHLARALDIEGKIPRAFEALGPVAGRDVILVDGSVAAGASAGIRARQLTDLGARVSFVESCGPAPYAAPAGSADVVIACWSALRGAPDDEVAQAARSLRPGGRLLVLHDYGRDDVATLRGELPEHGAWSRRGGPFLRQGFKIRVVHCWWTFATMDEMATFLDDAFGATGRALAGRLTRPRLSYNVAVYHRAFGEAAR